VAGKKAGKKKELHPALRANADKLKNGEALSPGRKKRPTSESSATAKKVPPSKPVKSTTKKQTRRGK
jgi:hypothetical protein